MCLAEWRWPGTIQKSVWVVPGLQLGQQSCYESLAFCPLSLLVLFDYPPVAFPWGHVTTQLESGPVGKDWEIEDARPERGKKIKITRA